MFTGWRFMLKSTRNTPKVGPSLRDVQENSLFQWHSLAWRLLLSRKASVPTVKFRIDFIRRRW